MRVNIKEIYRNFLPYKVRYLVSMKYNEVMTDRYINKFDAKKNELPRYIEIETINRCNGLCAFCPVNAKEPQRSYKKMSEELFGRIIDELASYDYDGQISLFSNNEPFLDERINEWIKRVAEKLPNSKIIMFTNGSMLTMDKFLDAIKYTHQFVIDNYTMTDSVNDNLTQIKQYVDSKHLNNVFFMIRKQDEILSSRGGQAPNKKNVAGIDARCVLPYMQMVIRPDGKCSLCCNDALGVYTLGDLNESSIKEIWKGKEYESVRRQMKIGKREHLKLCQNCDSLSYRKEKL